jgi:UDP-N-acetylmuramoylalanine--D-glutamate ligase
LVENEPDRVIAGITGTNGKSTTTALAGHLLRSAGHAAQVGGNIGFPVLDLLPNTPEDIYVLELSSYQLELTERLRCTVAVLLNLSPDHLDRHGGMAGYVRAKRRIFHNQHASDWAVLGVDDDHGRELLAELRRDRGRRLLPVAVGHEVEGGIFVIDGRLYDAIEGAPVEVADLRPVPTLQGAHNWQNAAAAYAVARTLGSAPEAAAAGLASFPGLPHRMEPVATIDGVRFVNDSKATNPDAAARALASFEEIYWIAGGRPKEGGLEPVLPWLSRVRHTFLIGEAAGDFARVLRAEEVRLTLAGDLATAVRQAAEAARREARDEPVVLLSPACASFDQFTDFEHRGDVFKRLVAELRQPAPVLTGGD